MTEITVIRDDDGTVIGLKGEGHSGDVPEGENLVCASVSTIFELLSEGASELPEDALTFRQNPEVPRWHIEVHQAELAAAHRETMESFFSAAIGVAGNLTDRYPERCRLID